MYVSSWIWNVSCFCFLFINLCVLSSAQDDDDADVISNESVLRRTKEEIASKSKVDTLGPVLKRHIQALRRVSNKKVDIIFLVDSSSSVGRRDFEYEIKFVRKLLADFTVDSNHTRVCVITFSSKGRVLKQIDYVGQPLEDKNKCTLLEEDVPNIQYVGGGTFTLGAFQEAKEVLRTSRRNSQKAIFLVTDGFSNGGDPRSEAKYLRDIGVKIFTFGIRNGNVRELHDMASDPKNETCYILDTFEEFEALARRALHEDLGTGSYVTQRTDKCEHLCINRSPCCDKMATCRCGTYTGNFECLCRKGYYGTGLYGECFPCPPGTYKDNQILGDESTCKKCPDENQSTALGATHVSQCSCKKGFRTFNGTGCSVLRCPELKKPANGYFVNDYCDSVFNAACGIKCKPGYELRGNSLRICQENGVWSGEEAECVMKTCPPLPTPKHGNMICDRDDFSFSTVCRFTCDTGYKLVGSRKRECLAIAYWTGIPTRCKEITCQPLPQVRDGVVKPLICTAKEVSFGTICQVECLSGYSLVGPERKQCTPEGMWAPESFGEMSRCEDKSPPFLLCPADIKLVAPDDDNAVEVNWQVPLALDNSGLLPIMTAVPAVEPPKRFPIGLTYVKYIAEDFSGNREKCRFSVDIADVTPPRVDSCFSPNPTVSSTFYAEVIWDEPQFSDNSGETPKVEKTHAPGLFPRGMTIVIYTASDESGNNSTCKLEIEVIPHPCQYPPEPVNGRRHCYETAEGVYCNVSCNEGFAFAIPPADLYFCAYDNVWTPEDKMPYSDCSVKTVTNSIELPASITYIAEVPCRDHLVLNQIQTDFQITLSGVINGLCATNMICEVADMEATCEEEVEDFNRIKIILGRRRRRDIVRIVSKESGDSVGGSDAHVASSITFDFIVRGQYQKKAQQLPAANQTQEVTEQLKGMLTVVKTEGGGGTLDIKVGGTKAKFANLTISKAGPRYKCKEGGVLVNTSCVKCPVGTFFNVVSKSCSGCPIGTYQPLEGSVACLVCPINTTTDHNNSKSEQECKAQCLPGTYSWDGLERCATCQVGFYQQEYGQTTCVKCPPGTTTKRRGSRVLEKCEEPCKPGYVSSSGLKPCFPCPKGTYQSDPGQTVCYECPRKALTMFTASTDVTNCSGSKAISDNQLQADEPEVVVYNDCFESKCQNGATCRRKLIGFTCDCPPGYKGLYCESRLDHCEGSPCLNGGQCNNHLTNFTCTCAAGFTGSKCEINIDDCISMPCENNGTCQDLANDFACSCPEFFKGPTCNTTVDFCTPSPCLNNGVCQQRLGGYNCSCPTGFRGTNCEINHDDCGSVPCQNGGTCEDGTASYRCQCMLGFTGEQCEVDIDDCSPDPCLNASRCEDHVNGFTCHCQKGFIGERCERELEVEYLLDFPFAGTFNYTSTTIDKDLASATVSFWMRTDDVINQGTPFSYASSPEMDNAFTLTSYDGFVVYVNNQQVSTDVDANDGGWHHIVFTWSSNRGGWKIYKDGVTFDTGNGLAPGQVIKGGGTFVIGQEQDSDGSYNSAESFVGQITHLNVWDRELTFTEIENMKVSCKKFEGNVIAWVDIQTGLHGALRPEPSNFCEGCPVPATPVYAQAEFSSTDPGATVTYSCLRGFEFLDRNTRQCLVTGEWSGADFQCLRVRCGYPERLLNGIITGRRYDYESTIRYSCDNNYRLRGPERRYCNENGTWEGSTPTCEEITCTLPLLSENTISTPSKQHYKARDTVIFSCREGYKLLTDHDFVFCQKDGTWDQSVPTCDPQTCKHTPSVPNAVAQDTKAEYSVGHTMTFTCNFGFRLSEVNPTGQISCLPNGHWESNIPVCEIVTCPIPPTVLHSDSDIGRLTYLGRVTYNCDPGYELFGPTNVIECLEEGSWDPSPPECLPVECGDPGLIANGHVTSLSYTFKSVASYKCNYGYVLRGNGSRVCQSNKEWSGTAPVCSPVSCGQPETIENGVFEENGDTYGSIATYGCYPGYDLQGEAERTCEASAMWSGSAPGCTKKECGSPPPVIHGHQTSSGVYFQDTVNYTCETGFRLNGFSYLRCLANGEWGPLPPVCEAITCPTPEVIQNGNYTTTGDVFGSRVEYFCFQGYKLTAESIRVCQPDGSWSSKVPSCAADECPIPLPVENGRFDFKDRSLGSVVLYFCNTGYKLNGTDFRRCESTLSWSGDEPVCTPKSCVEPDDILNGERNVSGMLYNSIVTYKCDIGYNMTGSSQRTCLSSGSWSGTAPTCNPIVCDTPTKVISNGRSFGNSSTYQSVVTYMCDPGYNLNGASRRQCLISGHWDFEIPICEVVHCARPHLRNGVFSNFKTEYSSIVTFQCRSGYVLFGASERTCLESGFWSGRSPVCVKVKEKPNVEYASVLSNGYNITYSCLYGYRLVGDPTLQFQEDGQWHGNTPNCVPIECNTTSLNIDNFMNGEIVVGNITVGSSAVFTCKTGFTLTGPSSRVCLSDGSWSGSNPICNIVYCSGKFQIDNGIISGPSNHFNSSLQFTCVPGYRLIGDDIITCLENGSWSGSSPVCERITCSLPNDTIVLSASYSTLTVGGNVHYTCPQNYRMIGDSLRTCLTSGEWSGIEPTCRVKQCPIPIISNGRIEMTSRNIGSFITYTCNEGYILVGSVGRFCTTAETWTQEDPTCEVIRCPSPPTIYGGIVLDNGRADFVYGDMVRYKCNEGFVIQEGDTEHICQGSGTWLGQLPVCASVACGPPPVIQNSASKLLNTTYTFNSVVEYTCNEGYRSQSSHSLTSKCQASGSWSLVSFTCLKVQCPSFPTIANGNVLGDSITFGSNISVLCDVGFIITGESHITCLSNGSWSIAQFPSCKRIACPIPDIISNGNVRYNELYVGDSVQYSCSTGFELVGNSKRICTGSGQWSGNKPYCQRVVCSDPPIHPNAVVSINTTEYYSSDEITYSCLPGYTMTVQGRLLCNSKGLWEGTAPTCTKIKCEQPSYIANGDPHFTDITFGSAVTYTCRSGYVLSGSTSMTCLETGSWSGARPTCNPVDCGPATPIEDGVIVGDVYTYGNSVTYICDEGFELTGASDLICRADRTWSNPPPLCQRINCGPPPTVSDADILGNNFFFQGVVTYTCHSGYKMRGDATIVCGSNAKWSSNVTRCELITCGEPPEIPNARVSVSGQRSNSLATYMCSNGYTMVGDPIAVCTNTGVWSVSKRFSCDPVDCGSPPSITNATVSYKSTTFSSYAVYRCQQGYSLRGNDRIQCGGSGLWDSSLPVCVMELCPAPDLPPNVIIDSGTYRSGDSLVFRCSDGYDLLGSKTIACTASGTWSSSVPNCQIVHCPRETGVLNTQDFNQEFPYGETRSASCKGGFETAGSLDVTCQSNGKWSTPTGYCRKFFCGKPPVTDMINIIRVQGRSYSFRDQVRYQCRPGIQPIRNPPIITCLDTGQWDGQIACYLPCRGGCQNGGSCLGYRGCKCPPGYGGKRCEKALCILPCLHRGHCISPYLCACPPEYTGSRCQKPVCNPPCQNNGICEKPNVCHCQHGFQGPRCEKSDLRTFERAARARQTTTSRPTVTEGWSWQ